MGTRTLWSLWADGIRQSLILLLPLTLIGALANAALYLPIPAYRHAMSLVFGPDWTLHATTLTGATNGITGLACAMVVAARIALLRDPKERRHFPFLVSTILVAAAGFVLGVAPDGSLSTNDLGFTSLLKGMLIGVITAEALHRLEIWAPASRHAIDYQLGDFLQFAIRMSVLGALVLGGVWIGSALTHQGLHTLQPAWLWLDNTLAALTQWGSTLPNAVLVVCNQLLWLVGINGGQVLLQLAREGSPWIASVDMGLESTLAHPMFVNAFGHLGGAGGTWGLILAILWKGRDPTLRRLAWASVLPALINVNELLLFGIPLVMGLRWVVPFVLAPLLATVLSQSVWILCESPSSSTLVSWSTPILLSGYQLTGSWLGVAIQLAGLALCTAIYLPWVKGLERSRQEDFTAALKASLDFLCSPTRDNEGLLERSDRFGRVARALVKDFESDLGSDRVYLVYQPVHDSLGRVVSAEALLRWQHAEYGAIPPPAVINPAEECDLIHRIGAWAIDQACADLRRWQALGHGHLVVAVNVSPIQLDAGQLVDIVATALKRHHVRPDQLKLEVTEGRALNFSGPADAQLQQLQKMGIQLCMDDFGMGYTSLLYMQRLKLSAIKLDGCLTRDIEHNDVSQDIVRTITRLGRSQGVNVVAEYVETASQQALLQDLGCDRFQGWLYSPGLRATALSDYLTQGRPRGGA